MLVYAGSTRTGLPFPITLVEERRSIAATPETAAGNFRDCVGCAPETYVRVLPFELRRHNPVYFIVYCGTRVIPSGTCDPTVDMCLLSFRRCADDAIDAYREERIRRDYTTIDTNERRIRAQQIELERMP